MCGLTLLMGRRKTERLLRKMVTAATFSEKAAAIHKPSKTRSRVEHILGIQKMRAGNLIRRTIGIARAKAKIGWRNLAYNIDRYCLLAQP